MTFVLYCDSSNQRLLTYALSWKSGVTLVLVIAVGAHSWEKLLLRTAEGLGIASLQTTSV